MRDTTGTSQPADRLRILTDDHQFEVVQDAAGKIHTLRFGEKCAGPGRDDMILALARDLHAARIYIAELEQASTAMKRRLDGGRAKEADASLGDMTDPFDAPGAPQDETPTPRM